MAAEGFLQTVYKNQATSRAFYRTACPLFELFLISLKLKSFFKLSKCVGDDLLPCVEEVFQPLVPTLGHELWVMTERVRWWLHPAEMSFLCLGFSE